MQHRTAYGVWRTGLLRGGSSQTKLGSNDEIAEIQQLQETPGTLDVPNGYSWSVASEQTFDATENCRGSSGDTSAVLAILPLLQ